MKLKLLLSIFLSLLFNTVIAQNIEGIIRDKINNIVLESVTVEVIYQNDTTKRKSTITDNSGYYELSAITTSLLNYPLFGNDKIIINYSGNKITVAIKTNYQLKTGKIYTVDGREIAASKFTRTGNNKYYASFLLNEIPEQILLISDGVHPAVKYILNKFPIQPTQVIDYKSENYLKSGFVENKYSFLFRVDDDKTDIYQPIQDTVEIDMDYVNYIDFELERWPTYILNLHFDVEDNAGINLENATVRAKEFETGTLNRTEITNTEGKANMYNIPTGHEEGNKLDPRITNWIFNVEKNGYKPFADTVFNIGPGDRDVPIILTEEGVKEYFANFNLQAVKDIDGSLIVGANAKFWETGTTDTTRLSTDTQGYANFMDIKISSANGESADNVVYGYSLEKEGLEKLVDQITLTEGTFDRTERMKEEQVTPTDKQYTIILTTNDEQGNKAPSMDWEIRNATNEIIDFGNSGSNSIDTAQFVNTNSNLNIILNTEGDEYKQASKSQTVNAGQTSITTVNELMTYLYEWNVFAKDSETGNLLDSINVKSYFNNNLLAEENSGNTTTATSQTTQPGHEIDLGLLVGRNGYENHALVSETINEGQTSNFTYTLVKKSVTPTEKDYMIILESEDDEGNNLVGFNWLVNNIASGKSWTGNSGANIKDTLNITDLNSTINATVQTSKTGYDDYNITTSFTEGQNNLTATNPRTTYNYNVTIVSEDENGNPIPNAPWSFFDESSNKTWTGNTGGDGIDLLEYSDVDQNSDVTLTITADEHEDDVIATNIQSGENTILTSDNVIKTYNYAANVGVTNSENGNVLDSLKVDMFLNGQLMDSDNTLESTIANLEMTKSGHTQDVKFIVERNGFFTSDSLSATVNEGETNNFTYQLTPESVAPTEKQYTIAIESNTPDVAWTITGDENIWNGNTGTDSKDTLRFTSFDDSEVIDFEGSKTEYSNFTTQETANAEELLNINSTHERLKYLYEAAVGATNSESGVALDSIEVDMYYNGELVDTDQSLTGLIADLEMQAIDHTQNVEFVVDKNGYVKSDKINATLNEGEANEFTYSLVKEAPVEPEDAVAYLWRLFSDPNQSGSIADITITNEEFDYSDTRTGIGTNEQWRDTVPVNPTGTTEYKINIIPRIGTGDKDLYPLEKIITLQANGTAQGMDEPESIRQQVRIQGRIMDGVTKNNVGGYTVTIKDESGNVVETVQSANGTYMSEMLDLDFEGSMNVQNANDGNHFGHKGIPIVLRGTTGYGVNVGPVVIETEINRFTDTLKIYNVGLLPARIQDSKTGQMENIDLQRLRTMDGNNSYYLPTTKDWPINVHFGTGTTAEQKQWAQSIFDLINDDFGIPFVLNEVGSELPINGITIESLDESYLNSIKSQTGMNMQVSPGAGITYVEGNDNIDEINMHGNSNIRIRAGTTIKNGEDYNLSTVGSLRELLFRTFYTTEYNGMTSVSNGSTPQSMTEEDMTQDRIHYKLIYELRKGKADSNPANRINTGSYTYTVN